MYKLTCKYIPEIIIYQIAGGGLLKVLKITTLQIEELCQFIQNSSERTCLILDDQLG